MPGPGGTRQRIKKNFTECQIGGTQQREDLTSRPTHTAHTHARALGSAAAAAPARASAAPRAAPPEEEEKERRRRRGGEEEEGGRRRKRRRRKKKEGGRRRRRRHPGRRSHVPGASPAVDLSTGALATSPLPPYNAH